MDNLNNLWNEFEEFIKNNRKIIGFILVCMVLSSAVSMIFSNRTLIWLPVMLGLWYGFGHNNPAYSQYRIVGRILLGLMIAIIVATSLSWFVRGETPWSDNWYGFNETRTERRIRREEEREDRRAERERRREERQLRKDERKQRNEERRARRAGRYDDDARATNRNKNAKANYESASDGQKNAIKEANRHLITSPISRSELIKQLEMKKHAREDAEYAADNCGADWNEQAYKKGKAYIEVKKFLRTELIDQLEFDGFTHDQAVYAAEKLV